MAESLQDSSAPLDHWLSINIHDSLTLSYSTCTYFELFLSS
ncbi:hypothetical protein RSAG8_14015, partial [Rhizoctonia solani AG-8 WAC10335]